MTPAIIIGGVSFGIFTPTEAAVAARVWALFLGLIFYPLSLRSVAQFGGNA